MPDKPGVPVSTQAAGNARLVTNLHVHQYWTTGIAITLAPDYDPTAHTYWQQKIGTKYGQPLLKDVESDETEPVLEAAWTVRPTKALTVPVLEYVALPVQGAMVGGVYEITFQPGKPANNPIIEKISQNQPVFLTPSPTKPQNATYPGDLNTPKIKRLLDAHPDEKSQILLWAEGAPEGETTQAIISTSGKAGHASTFAVTVTKEGTDVSNLEITLKAEKATRVMPKANDKTLGDLAVDEQQEKKDKLGTVDVSNAPQEEAAWVQQWVAFYFDGGVRDAEVDVVIPINGEKILYSLRFYPKSNDVQVERVGKVGEAEMKIYPGDFATNSASWFKTEYSIDVLDANSAPARLRTHNGGESGTKDFDSGDLALLTLALQKLSPAMTKALSGLNLVRQESHPQGGNLAGWTYYNFQGDKKWQTVAIYDRVSLAEGILFAGGSRAVIPPSALTYIHELGHVVSNTDPQIQKSFNALVKRKAIKPVTSYGATKAAEFFAEAFALFHGDPEWMQNNIIDLYRWFETFTTSGTPPP